MLIALAIFFSAPWQSLQYAAQAQISPPLPAQANSGAPKLDYGGAVTNDSDYLVGPKDVLKITVYRSPDLDTTVPVAADGTIQMGGIGRLQVADMSVAAISKSIEQKLRSSGIFLDPTVTVLVAEYHARTASVLGAVAKPGEYPLDRRNLTITEILARAGANFESGGTLISVVPADDPTAREKFYVADLVAGRHDRFVRPGESIFVQAPATFYISGAVQKPGAYPIEPGLTVGQAVAIAGGLTSVGSKSRIRVTHRTSDQQTGKGEKVKLSDIVQPNDLLVVGERLF